MAVIVVGPTTTQYFQPVFSLTFGWVSTENPLPQERSKMAAE